MQTLSEKRNQIPPADKRFAYGNNRESEHRRDLHSLHGFSIAESLTGCLEHKRRKLQMWEKIPPSEADGKTIRKRERNFRPRVRSSTKQDEKANEVEKRKRWLESGTFRNQRTGMMINAMKTGAYRKIRPSSCALIYPDTKEIAKR